MKTSTTISGLRVKSSIKAGGFGSINHSAGLRVKTSIKAGGFGSINHSAGLIRIA